MSYLFLSFKIIFPILFYIAVGCYLKNSKEWGNCDFGVVNRLVFRIFLPTNLFMSIVTSDLTKSFQIGLIGFVLLGVALCFGTLCFVVPKFLKDERDATVVILSIYRSNYILFGLSVTNSIYPNGDLGVVSALAAFTIPLFNVLTILLFKLYIGKKASIREIIIEVVKNRFVVAGFLAGVMALMNFHLPELLVKPLKSLADISTPLALICLGASLSYSAFGKYAKILIACCMSRLVILPSIFILLGILLGYRNMELVAIMLMFGSPTAVTSYAMAKEMGGNSELISTIIAATSLLSVATMFFWIFLLMSLQMI